MLFRSARAAVDDEQLELTLDDDALAALAAADTAQARVWDDAGEAVVVELDVAEITRALAEADADRTGGER